MIVDVRPGVRSGERQGYASALDGLWSGLARTLSELERYAADPSERLAEDGSAEALAALQYRLHLAGELAAGIVPPPGAATGHEELAAALADARDATAEVVEAVDGGGPDEAAFLVPEWRGALFRVRLARMRLLPKRAEAPQPEPEERHSIRRDALGAATASIFGAALVAAGATAALWPLWAAGFVLFAASFFLYRP
jgi:hypothetical protein